MGRPGASRSGVCARGTFPPESPLVPSRSEVPLGSPGARAAIVALVVLVAAILSAVVLFRPRARQPPPAAAIVRVSAEPPAAAVTPTAALLVDAIPWGRIERIETSAGEPRELPEARETPVLLELPAGDWRVVLSNPSFAEERVCAFTLVGAGRHHCLVEFERLSVDRYFQEAGWWR